MNAPFIFEQLKDIISPSILWLPVQTYYSIYSALVAALLSHGQMAETHAKALNCYSEQFRRKMPYPLNCSCKGVGDDIAYDGFQLAPNKDYSTLKRPRDEKDAHDLLGTALRTTRGRLIKMKCDSWKKQEKRKLIRSAKRREIGMAETPTTILHFLYRLRLRSNYGDTDLFVSGSTESERIDFAKSYVTVTDYTLGALEVLVEKRLGLAFITEQISLFSRRFRGKVPVAARWSDIKKPV